ncbi:restriction endonuclease subunit S [Finegoldia magna]|uniref:restriction endonuclease subunit S n=1 Tax=Finegoldia magna TaxID=1260 RepID=UPI002903317E|nr:restriction endonuclease subunit S [Finegoldia magna]MDU1579951.1 restriction endonuclease subunit S [Finegoldia magna]MDU1600715.1 restriction endonuclease subunit S [Finegoldia magna]
MEFKKVTLGEISINSRGYYGIGASAVDFDPELPTYLRITDINDDGSLNKDNLKSINEEDYEKYILKENDIVFARTGNSTGRNYFYEKKDGLLVFAGFLIKFSLDKEKVFPKYIKYVCQSKEYWGWINSIATGSTRKNINAKMYEKMPIFLPEEKTQEKIVTLLESLDSKIEINNKIISNLESQAQAIFKSWFVDFEPFQDGDFVESELGMIPEGWEVKSLSDIAFFKNGLAMQKYRPEINDPSLPVLKIRELNSGSTDFSSDRCRTDIDDSVKVYDGDLIFSWSGTLSCKLWTGGNAGLNQHLFKVTSEKYEKWFNYSWVKFHMNEFIRIAQDKATTMGHIKRSHLDEAKVLIPTIDIYEKIDKLMKPIIELIIKLGIQNTKLAELRDALLPKLMAGEIDVSNIKIEGEEVKNE